jgi:hypothetical protein
MIHEVLIRTLEWTKPHPSTNYRWEDDIKIDFTGIGCEDMDSIRLAPVGLSGFIKEEEFFDQLRSYQFLKKGSAPYSSLVFTVRCEVAGYRSRMIRR